MPLLMLLIYNYLIALQSKTTKNDVYAAYFK